MSGSKQYPLSGVQRGFVSASGIGATRNTVPATYLFEGPFSTEDILAALGKVVRRHEALRTRFDLQDGKPFQQPIDRMPRLDRALYVEDLRSRRGQAQARVNGLVEKYLAMPFDLRQDLPWRGFLARISDTRWVMGLMFAHVIVDGTSVGVIAEDLAAALGDRERPAPLQIGVMAEREAALKITAEQARFWAGEYALRKPLPDRWDGPEGTFHIVPVPVFEPALVRRLDALRASHGLSITSVLGALVGVAGRRLTGGDLMVGYATAQRARGDRPGTNQWTVGACHDHLPAMAVAAPEMTFLDCVAAVQERREGARRHRLPTGHLRRIAKATNKIGTPYDVAVNYGRFGAPVPIPVPGSTGVVIAVPVEAIGPVNVRQASTAAPAMAFIASPDGDGAIKGVMTGISGLFSAEQVGRFPAAMHAVAEVVAADPATRIQRFLRRR